ncbi:ADP-ribosylglycohydrolase family protein [Thermobifida halotolerans]|uniref:ADP-ribosylglycohydrolase family protein n=1 Tax=Thermobifida halotolerans TaxID=483545 RepID=A0AA97LZU0_9ACTN|nr:ADP-ribosylglycohydrolase family protein [Thermobifida halotolerans]UOE21357.1 ADP-ribosylglycohydrolase family protein [Thermobifida halotolerans]
MLHVLDRAAGVLLGAACGDALGVPYEFAPRLDQQQTPRMIGGGLGPYAPGEYSDDTQMAVCIAQVAATGADLRSSEALDQVAHRFVDWHRDGASDIGIQTAAVLGQAARNAEAHAELSLAEWMLAASGARVAQGRPSAGNGSLMRTAPVALAFPHDPEATAEAARRVSELTHADPLAADACVLWCEGIRHAVAHGTFDGVRRGLRLLETDRRAQWEAWLDEAEHHPPHTFTDNGFVVRALQAAWSAITRTPVPEHRPADGVFAAQHLQHALEAAARAGGDTDTVAAIAGALLGARWGASAIPWQWQRAVHGWPGLHTRDLTSLAVRTFQGGHCDAQGWPEAARHPFQADVTEPFVTTHPHDDGVLLGNLRLARPWQETADAVVSLCRTGTADFTEVPRTDHVRVWLIDQVGANAHVHFTLDQAAHAVAGLRAEGKRVLLHCAAGRSRTPAVAARYATLLGLDPATAFHDILRALAPNRPLLNPELETAVHELAGHPVPPRQSRSQGSLLIASEGPSPAGRQPELPGE